MLVLRPSVAPKRSLEVVVPCSAVPLASALFLTLAPLALAACVVNGAAASADEPRDAVAPAAGPEATVDAASGTLAAAPSPELASPEVTKAPLGVDEASAASCPADMVLASGAYCPEVKQTCLRWLDPPGSVYSQFRCALYGKPQCLSAERAALRFCIDRDEYTPPGAELPVAHQSWTSAGAICAAQGKRLCAESEWQFACEGPEMHAYPYGDGFHRDASACNIDRSHLGRPNSGLRDLRAPSGSHPRCVSPFGVRDMSGNVEEWTTLDHPADPRDKASMKGAWWLPGRNHCRAATTGHGETYEGPQVGVRCCRDAS